MRRMHPGFPACLFAFCLASAAAAQTATPQPVSETTVQQAPLTGKERLGPKWTDEQRIDNCNVPPDKRGSRPRPSECPHIPTG